MSYFILLVFAILIIEPKAAQSQSNLLESVKRNPTEAINLCKRFRVLNSKGISATSEDSLKEIMSKKNLSKLDADIFSTYVIGLNCPDVK
tara:strand:- start:129 stop:398 length:270 start_codon:yes stop_codon:yes gene_type:complete